MPIQAKFEYLICTVSGLVLSVTTVGINWNDIYQSSIKAAIVGIIGGIFGMLGKLVYSMIKKFFKR